MGALVIWVCLGHWACGGVGAGGQEHCRLYPPVTTLRFQSQSVDQHASGNNGVGARIGRSAALYRGRLPIVREVTRPYGGRAGALRSLLSVDISSAADNRYGDGPGDIRSDSC